MRDTRKLQEELEYLMQEYEKAAQQRLLLRQEQQDVSEVVINAAQTNNRSKPKPVKEKENHLISDKKVVCLSNCGLLGLSKMNMISIKSPSV